VRPRLLLVTASTRPSRKGPLVAAWVERVARAHGGFEVDPVDLAEVGLPLLDEPHHPRLRRYVHPHTLAWSERVDAADAVVLVFPEYNHSFSGALKNAIDFLHQEWGGKAVGLVSYGGASSGLRAAAALKQVLTSVRMVPVVEAVSVPFFEQFVQDGEFVPNEVLTTSAGAMLDEVARMTALLRPATSGPGEDAAGTAGT
jgi:NAD(P)H-dependent FMN reductase